MITEQNQSVAEHDKKRYFHKPMEFGIELGQRTLLERAFFLIPELQDQELTRLHINSRDFLTTYAVIGAIVTSGLYKTEYDETYPELQNLARPFTVYSADEYDFVASVSGFMDTIPDDPNGATLSYCVAIGANNPNCRYVMFASDQRCTLLVIDEYTDMPRAATHSDALLGYRMDIFYQSIMDKAEKLRKSMQQS